VINHFDLRVIAPRRRIDHDRQARRHRFNQAGAKTLAAARRVHIQVSARIRIAQSPIVAGGGQDADVL